MSYVTLSDITAEVPADVWDGGASAEPSDTVVTEWIDQEEKVLEGAVAHVVTVPVSPAISPQLYETFRWIIIQRGAARVERMVFGLRGGESGANPTERERLAQRREDLIRAGAIADGVRLGGGEMVPGSPSGYFGEDDEEPFFTRADEF